MVLSGQHQCQWEKVEVGVSAGPDLNESGLVLALDGANYKSFKGSAATNLLYSITNTYGTQNGTHFKTSYGDVIENIPSLGYKTVRYCNIFNDYPNSGDCCPSPLRYGGSLLGQTIAVSSSTTYTYQIIYKVKSGYTHPNFMYRYEFGNSGYVTEGGVHSESNRTSLGNDWWFAWGQFTTQSTTTYLWLTGMWYYQYNVYDTVYIAGVSLHQGTNIIPAKFMLTAQENRGTTVATGGGWTDLTGRGNNGELVNGVKESGDNLGSLSFDGSDDRVTISTINLGNGNLPWTCTAWVKTTTTVNSLGYGSVLSNSASGPVYSMMGVNNGKIVYWTYQNAAWAQKLGVGKTINDNVWHFLSWVNYSNYTMDMYVDGALDSNVANSTSGNNNPINIIGASWAAALSANIAQVSIYNRALTSAEIRQNFNATRGRFGI